MDAYIFYLDFIPQIKSHLLISTSMISELDLFIFLSKGRNFIWLKMRKENSSPIVCFMV
jgi:hypothetical protein